MTAGIGNNNEITVKLIKPRTINKTISGKIIKHKNLPVSDEYVVCH